MKTVYCSKCGTKLPVILKALPKYGTVINLVKPHRCTKEPIPLDLTPISIPTFNTEVTGEFVQQLNDLNPPPIVKEIEPGDKRDKADIKTTAPPTVLDMLESMENSTPDKEPAVIESEG